jgi:hypothetical protein
MRRALLLAWSVGVAGCATSAEGKPLEPELTVTQISNEMSVVRQHRILFSHHSVGRDLMAGLQRAAARLGGPIRVVPIEKADDAPAFVSVSGGQNQDPQSKLVFFEQTFRSSTFQPELAFLKLCYVDFNPHTDVDALFESYQKTIDALKRDYPKTRFAHVTTPLVAKPMQLKERMYRLFGREVWEDTANVKRHAFNQRVMQAYAGDPIFDLARIESTRPDGSRVDFEHDGRVYYSLANQYTEDGGHLNNLGQDVAALEWVRFMAGALQRSTTN